MLRFQVLKLEMIFRMVYDHPINIETKFTLLQKVSLLTDPIVDFEESSGILLLILIGF